MHISSRFSPSSHTSLCLGLFTFLRAQLHYVHPHKETKAFISPKAPFPPTFRRLKARAAQYPSLLPSPSLPSLPENACTEPRAEKVDLGHLIVPVLRRESTPHPAEAFAAESGLHEERED